MKLNNKDSEFNFFSSRTIGRSLKEVAVDLIQTENDDVVSRWFHSQSETDLYTWVDTRHNILKQQLSFYGQIVEWNCIEGLKTGVTVESDLDILAVHQKGQAPAASQNKASETIQFDNRPQPKTIELALEILRSMEEGDSNFRTQLVTNFENPQNIQTMASSAFVERFGLDLKNYQAHDQSFWDSMKSGLRSLFTK